MSTPVTSENQAFARERERLLREIVAEVSATAGYTGRKRLSPALIDVIRRVPRHEFVPESHRDLAYANHPLSIGHGQTISQPYIVAIMTELLDLERNHAVLEVGTGSGYQAAFLAELAGTVYTVETVFELYQSARERLTRLGYRNIHFRHDDGARGWPEAAPFDAIVVTAAAARVPSPLIDQLKPGGRMVIPVGGLWFGQELVLVTKERDGTVEMQTVLGVAFVPLVTSHPDAS